MGVDELSKRWDAEASKRPILDEMTFKDGFLVLGAGTRLAKVGAALDEARFVALLTAAHGRRIEPSPLKHVQRALEKKREGDLSLALMHLALSGLAKLHEPIGDAKRMSMADMLLAAGVPSRTILEALFNPAQPRVPAGNGRISGQWVGENSDQESTNRRQSDLPILLVADQGAFHDALRDQFADDLRKAGNTVFTEVPLVLQTEPPTPPCRIDLLLRNANGVLFAIEVKTGDSPQFTTPQMVVYPHLGIGGLVVAPDPRVSELGLTPGQTLPPVDAVVLYSHGPGEPIYTLPMSRFLKQ